MQKSDVVIPIRGTRDRWPRDQAGDPSFDSFEALHVLFSDEQILAMCNRYLRQQEYQTEASRQYEQKKSAAKKLARGKKPPTS